MGLTGAVAGDWPAPDALTVELHRWSAVPFVWGQTDCVLVLADWVARVTGVDPAAEVRMTYTDAAECQKATGFLRDPVGTLDRFAGLAGLSRADRPARGDVAVIRRHHDPRWPVGALWLGECWACKGPDGVTTLRPALAQVLAVWGVGYAA